TDEKGNPLKSASVVISGKTIGTITDNDGNFILKLTDDSPIVISYVGFGSQKINPDFEKEMVITMKTRIVRIDPVGNDASVSAKESKTSEISDNVLVIIDGKESTKAEMTGINPDKIEKIDVLKNQKSIEKYGEKGKYGVIEITLKTDDKTTASQTFKVQTNSPLKFGNADGSGKQPLIVIDGVVDKNQNANNIPPENIESISVLKGESATKKYGEKGKNGILEIKTKKVSDVFTVVEEMPEFPGGMEALKAFIIATMKYPVAALEKGIQGKVYVNFVVTKIGSVAKAKVVRGVDPSLDNEAIRVVEGMPNWKPGSQNGENVDVSYTVPVNFNLPSEKISKEKLH
ncbi:MAG: TonB family protein, partial [Bacteroidota bacterium]|nr:TonB family protein [Bacteroidota bacterium]